VKSPGPAVVVPVDDVGAFMGSPRLLAPGAADQPLSGMSLAVKDLFDVAGTVTGAGNPSFAAGRPPADSHATAVSALLRAGASVVGKTVTDELAYSLSGTNVHYGTPRNVAAPGRVPGGSSAGSAAAVAAGLVDLALGTDTGGSIRVPASYCGIFGWRPTHGVVSTEGVVPLAPSFDTVGLLAPDMPALMAGAVALLGPDSSPDGAPSRLAVVALPGVLGDVASQLGLTADPIDLGVDLDDAVQAFRWLQGAEAWATHGPWITATNPAFGPGIASRFKAASAVTAADVAAGNKFRDDIAAAVRAATADGTILVMPAAPGPAPLPHPAAAVADAQRGQTLRLTCLAGLAGAPVVVAPLLRAEGLPLGVAFIGAPGTDRQLLRWATETVMPLVVERRQSEVL